MVAEAADVSYLGDQRTTRTEARPALTSRDLAGAPRIRALAEFVKDEARKAEQLFLADALIGN